MPTGIWSLNDSLGALIKGLAIVFQELDSSSRPLNFRPGNANIADIGGTGRVVIDGHPDFFQRNRGGQAFVSTEALLSLAPVCTYRNIPEPQSTVSFPIEPDLAPQPVIAEQVKVARAG